MTTWSPLPLALVAPFVLVGCNALHQAPTALAAAANTNATGTPAVATAPTSSPTPSTTTSTNPSTSPATTSTTPSIPAAAVPVLAQYFGDIDQMAGWQDCGACSGPGGQGAEVPHALTQNVANPSEDGSAAQFWVGGSVPYASALWWKQLGPQPQATHFVYELDFYLTDSAAVQALEFDINQSVGGYKYIFGSECNVLGGNRWDVWDTANARWTPTGVPCVAPAANQWHHVMLEVERVGSQAHFIAVGIDGQRNPVDMYFQAEAVNAAELNVAVQLDENAAGTNYALWVDKARLSFQ